MQEKKSPTKKGSEEKSKKENATRNVKTSADAKTIIELAWEVRMLSAATPQFETKHFALPRFRYISTPGWTCVIVKVTRFQESI